MSQSAVLGLSVKSQLDALLGGTGGGLSAVQGLQNAVGGVPAAPNGTGAFAGLVEAAVHSSSLTDGVEGAGAVPAQTAARSVGDDALQQKKTDKGIDGLELALLANGGLEQLSQSSQVTGPVVLLDGQGVQSAGVPTADGLESAGADEVSPAVKPQADLSAGADKIGKVQQPTAQTAANLAQGHTDPVNTMKADGLAAEDAPNTDTVQTTQGNQPKIDQEGHEPQIDVRKNLPSGVEDLRAASVKRDNASVAWQLDVEPAGERSPIVSSERSSDSLAASRLSESHVETSQVNSERVLSSAQVALKGDAPQDQLDSEVSILPPGSNREASANSPEQGGVLPAIRNVAPEQKSALNNTLSVDRGQLRNEAEEKPSVNKESIRPRDAAPPEQPASSPPASISAAEEKVQIRSDDLLVKSAQDARVANAESKAQAPAAQTNGARLSDLVDKPGVVRIEVTPVAAQDAVILTEDGVVSEQAGDEIVQLVERKAETRSQTPVLPTLKFVGSQERSVQPALTDPEQVLYPNVISRASPTAQGVAGQDAAIKTAQTTTEIAVHSSAPILLQAGGRPQTKATGDVSVVNEVEGISETVSGSQKASGARPANPAQNAAAVATPASQAANTQQQGSFDLGFGLSLTPGGYEDELLSGEWSEGDLPLSSGSRADGTAQRIAALPQSTLRGVPSSVWPEIARQAQSGNGRFEIRLNPQELGGVDVTLDIQKDGKVRGHLVVERPETLELLQRDQRGLEKALQEAGLQSDKGSLQFSLRQDGGQGAHQFAEDDTSDHRSGVRGSSSQDEGSGEIVPAAAVSNYNRAGSSGGLDISV